MESDVLYAVKPARARRVAPVSRAILGRALDLTLALLLLVILAPLMAVIALAIRLDSPGSPIFRQRRLGRRERPFTVNKFRTMRAASDSEPHRAYIRELIAHGAGAARQDGAGKPLFKLAVDDRVTRTGRFLRRWSLDELPQFLQVLRGEMSLVGPRPQLPEEVASYDEWHHQRLLVTPGLTGLWQVNGRSNLTFDEMVRLDLYYAEHWSPWLDAKILLRTIPAVLSGRGAY